MKRRIFLRNSLLSAGALAIDPLSFSSAAPKLKISLAEWSLHRALQAKQLNHLDFPITAKKIYGIDAVEYVSGFFGLDRNMTQQEAGKNTAYLKELLQRSKDAGVYNNLIMVDQEGPLAIPDDTIRLKAVDDHKKWVDAASLLGCTIVRVNLQGEGDRAAKKTAAVDSLSRLGEYAGSQHINVVVENHGGDSSRADWLVSIMQQVGRKNVGTLPDFGNFCIGQAWGSTQGNCPEAYDTYTGVAELLPFAKGVSAKTYDFDANGNQPKMDYQKLIGLVKKSGFNGYIGIEYEGENQPEDEGIKRTKALLNKLL